MDSIKREKIKIIPKPENITWEQITDLLHLAFAERAEQGLQYKAVNQDVQTTITRVGDGICLVAMLGDKLVGTETLRIKKGKNWFEGERYGYLTQLAVHPEYKKMGIGNVLMSKLFKIAKELNLNAIVLHTSIRATTLVNWNIRLGAQKVAVISGTNNNYYSVVLCFNLGKPINKSYALIRFYWSYIYCVFTKTKKGKQRSWVTILKKIIKKLK